MVTNTNYLVDFLAIIMTKEERKIITHRISTIYDDLESKYFSGKKGNFANRIGTHSHLLTKMLRGERSMTPDHISNLLSMVPLNIKWLLGDDTAPIFLDKINQGKSEMNMEEIDRLNAKIKILEGDKENLEKRMENVLIENEQLKRKIQGKEVG